MVSSSTVAAETLQSARSPLSEKHSVAPNTTNNSDSNYNNNNNNYHLKRSDALSTEPGMGMRSTSSSIAHLFAITPHDYQIIQDWAW
ncbi:hypothetical protein BGZ65_004662, partial [Modicella reniformis]